jgi:molecular chaperone DnaK
MHSPVFGIDLGTTNSLIGVFEAGFPGLLANPDGERIIPSAVHFPPVGGPVVGNAALRQRALAPHRTITSVKRLMGMAFHEINPANFPWPVEADAEGMAVVRIDEKSWRPEELSALILKHLREIASFRTGAPATHAVITVPAYFRDSQRAATRRAGELAGWQVERILSEPTAAALACGWGQKGQRGKIAVFDLGGGTFDLSVLELSGGVFEVLATCGDTALGGDDIDHLLVEEIVRRLGWKGSDPLAFARLHEEATHAKVRLSLETQTEIVLPFLDGVTSNSLTIDRAEMETVARPVLDRIPALCRQALHDARVNPADLKAVLLVGGATRMPAVRKLAAEIFEQEPDTTQHPDESIALGACLQGGILAGVTAGVTLLDVTPLSLGIETYGGLMNVLIPRNSSIPCKAGELFTNAAEGQESMRVKVLQGEREMARDNWKLGEFDVTFQPSPRGTARIGVEFTIDADGILQVLARDTATGMDQVVKIESSIRVEDSRVEEMVSSSIENAFEDMNERVFAEARIKAQELLAALDAAFVQLGDSLPQDERLALDVLSRQTRDAMEARDARTLKQSVEILDEKTEPLAAMLLEKLMES